MAQNHALSKILINQQKLVEVVTQTFSSSDSLINDLKKKIQMIEQKLATIVSKVKGYVCFFPSHRAERK